MLEKTPSESQPTVTCEQPGTHPSLLVNGSPLSRLSIRAVTGESETHLPIEYPFDENGSTILPELLEDATTEYHDVTEKCRDRFEQYYRFTDHGDPSKPWFFDAELWPYTRSSERQLLHSIPYAYTGVPTATVAINRSDTGSQTPIGKAKTCQRTGCELPVVHAIAFFDPETRSVRVFGSEQEVSHPAPQLAADIFKPKLKLSGELVERDASVSITLEATPVTDQGTISDSTREFSVSQYLASLTVLDTVETAPLTDGDPIIIQGDLETVLKAHGITDLPAPPLVDLDSTMNPCSHSQTV